MSDCAEELRIINWISGYNTRSHVSQLVSVRGHARGPYWGKKKWNLLPDFAVYLNVTGKPAALAEVCVVHSSGQLRPFVMYTM